MIANLLTDVRDVPNLVRSTQERLREELRTRAERLAETPDEARRWVRRSAHTVSTRGADRLWTLHVNALEGAGHLLDKVADQPALERLEKPARELLANIEGATTRPPVEGYDELNVREIRAKVHEVDHLGLLRIRHYEAAHKARKTVLDAIAREFEHRERVANG